MDLDTSTGSIQHLVNVTQPDTTTSNVQTGRNSVYVCVGGGSFMSWNTVDFCKKTKPVSHSRINNDNNNNNKDIFFLDKWFFSTFCGWNLWYSRSSKSLPFRTGWHQG